MSVESLDEWRKKLARRSTSQSQSTQTSASDQTGQLPIDDEELNAAMRVYIVLERSKVNPFTTKSDFARMAANEVGICASEGLISTKVNEGQHSNVWMVTREGLDQMEELASVLSSRH